MDEPCGLYCPVCDHVAIFALGNHQAFCGNDDCRVVLWDPSLSVEANLADAHEVNLFE